MKSTKMSAEEAFVESRGEWQRASKTATENRMRYYHEMMTAKKEPVCTPGAATCPNMKLTYDGMDGERYRCSKCGYSYFLDYEEMR